MRKSLILVFILVAAPLLPFGHINSVEGQINPDISLNCDGSEVNFIQFMWDQTSYNGTQTACVLDNPTLYNEIISIEIIGLEEEEHSVQIDIDDGNNSSYRVDVDYPYQIVVDGGTQEMIRVNFLTSYDTNFTSRQVTISAKVEEADGSPCPTCTPQTWDLAWQRNWGWEFVQVEFNTTTHQGSFILEMGGTLDASVYFAVNNFLEHVRVSNTSNAMYNGTIFHRVIDDFMIQGGDIECGLLNSTCGPGTGGYAAIWQNYCNGEWWSDGPDSCAQEDWTVRSYPDNGLIHVPYALSMARTAAPNTGGSQFFIVDAANGAHHLDGVHTVFGHVVVGTEEIDFISEVATDNNNRPIDNVIITGMEIVEWPFEDEPDSDGDGVPDSEDAFPNDENETADSDGDGTGDNADAFPNDGNETHDDDNDGTGNNSDAFPQDGNETHDDDGDGVGNNSDAFPQDENETMDTDGDGVGDNSDADPDDPDVRVPADIQINVTDKSIYVLAFAILIFTAAMVFVRKRPPAATSIPFVTEGDSIWNDA